MTLSKRPGCTRSCAQSIEEYIDRDAAGLVREEARASVICSTAGCASRSSASWIEVSEELSELRLSSRWPLSWTLVRTGSCPPSPSARKTARAARCRQGRPCGRLAARTASCICAWWTTRPARRALTSPELRYGLGLQMLLYLFTL